MSSFKQQQKDLTDDIETLLEYAQVELGLTWPRSILYGRLLHCRLFEMRTKV